MKKTITGFIGACSLVALVACGSDGDKPTEVGTLTSSASATTTATSTTSSEAPATSSEIPTETPSVDSSAPAEVPSDPNVSSALPRTYAQACSDVLRYLDAYQPAIDESGEEMGMTREIIGKRHADLHPGLSRMVEPVCRRAGRGHSRIRRSDRGKLLTYFQNNDS